MSTGVCNTSGADVGDARRMYGRKRPAHEVRAHVSLASRRMISGEIIRTVHDGYIRYEIS